MSKSLPALDLHGLLNSWEINLLAENKSPTTITSSLRRRAAASGVARAQRAPRGAYPRADPAIRRRTHPLTVADVQPLKNGVVAVRRGKGMKGPVARLSLTLTFCEEFHIFHSCRVTLDGRRLM